MSSLKTSDEEASLLLRGNKLRVYLSPKKSHYVRAITDVLTGKTEFTSTTRIDISEVRCICKIDPVQIERFTGRKFYFTETHLKTLLVVFTSNWSYFIEASLIKIERLKYPNMVRINDHCMINVKYCNEENANSA